MTTASSMPRAFLWRRVHSLLGLAIVLFLTEHLFTNSQAALPLGENGMGFVRMVNWIKSLPYLPVIEITLIGVPIAVHGVLGVRYLFTAKSNSFSYGGKSPSLQYGRNYAYTFQRLTSWILLFGIVAHVGYLRFYKYPIEANVGSQQYYFTRISMDDGLYPLAAKLGVNLYGEKELAIMQNRLAELSTAQEPLSKKTVFDESVNAQVKKENDIARKRAYIEGALRRKISSDQVIAESTSFGTVTLLNVRDSFMSVWISMLYTIFVLAAVFHAYNGLWTFLITWGAVLRIPSQKRAVQVCMSIMAIIGALGIAAIWGTFWINLR